MDRKTKEDLARLVQDARQFGDQVSVMSFEEAVAKGDGKSGDRVLINLLIGQRGDLTRVAVRKAAKQWEQITAAHPHAMIYPMIAGYDTDVRELWDIPETREFFCRWAKRVGLDTIDAVRDSPLHEGAAAFLAKCGAVVDVSPYTVGVQRTSNH